MEIYQHVSSEPVKIDNLEYHPEVREDSGCSSRTPLRFQHAFVYNRSYKPYPSLQAASIVALAAFNVACVSRAILPFAIKLRSLAFRVVVE